MKKYYLYIKSHCEAPDCEDDCEARSRTEAINIFLKRINFANDDPWDKKALDEFVYSQEDLG